MNISRHFPASRIARAAMVFGVLTAAVATPLWVLTAASVPNTFVNGEISDADEVNENFAALKDAINENEAHIANVEATIAALQAQVSALQATVAGHTTSITNLESAGSAVVWQSQFIDENVMNPDDDDASSSFFAVDAGGNAHVSFGIVGGGVKYASNASGNWVTETVDNSGGSPSLALDVNGKAHVGYTAGGVLKYATNTSGGWATETVDGSGSYSAIAVGSNGKAYLAYVGANNALTFATNASGSWVTEIIDNDGGVLEPRFSIALDSGNSAHIGYHLHVTLNSSIVKYAMNASGSWSAEVVDDTHAEYGGLSLALGSDGKAHMCFEAGDGGFGADALKYATNASGTWTAEAIGGHGHEHLITIDTNGGIHIWQAQEQGVAHAANASGAWLFSIVPAPVAPVGQVVDSSGRLHLFHYALGGKTLVYMRQE